MTNTILSIENEPVLLLDVFPQAPVIINNGTVTPTDVPTILLSTFTSSGVGGGRLIGIDNGNVVLIDSTIPALASLAVGITKAAAAPATFVEYVFSGLVADSSWSWTSTAGNNRVYAGVNGLLTQTVPTTGFVLEVGKAISTTSILVDFKSPIILT